jgi:putative nucleotidyltransferase with HDIG domain
MVSIGHLLVYFARMVRKNEELLLKQNQQIAVMNAELEKGLAERTHAMQSVNQMTLQGWVKLLELRDFETEGHCSRVADLAGKLADHMGCPPQFVDCLRTGALLHDIGKLGVPDEVLLKRGLLTRHEKSLMEQHIQYGYNVLRGVQFLEPCLEVVLHHHERWDGSGYPQGLKGEEIPFSARLFSIVDVWDALTSDRPYRAAWTSDEALQYIHDQAGHQFDPMAVKAFLRLMAQKPTFTVDLLDRHRLRELLSVTIEQQGSSS